MRHGEPQRRVLLMTMPQPNLRPDFADQAKTFAGRLVDRVL